MSDKELDKIFDGSDGIDNFISNHKIADETFKKWIHEIDQSEFTLDNYKQYLKDTSKQTSVFTNFTSKAKTALKSLGASLASMAVNTAITIFVSSLIKLSQVSDEVMSFGYIHHRPPL